MIKATRLATIPSVSKSGYRPLGAAAATLPSITQAVDLRNFCLTIEDHGQLGSCTANAAVGLAEFFEKRPQQAH